MRSSAAHSSDNTDNFDSTIDLSGIPIDTSSPVMVTGATGYLGSWVTKGLLDAGVTVHAAVRDPQNTSKVTHLNRMAEQAPGTLRLFASDLLQPDSYDQAIEGCTVVIHTASPILHSTDDPQHDLIEPALEGTRNVLAGVERTPSVTRVVLTSSIVAMYGDAADIEGYPGRILTKTCWNTTSSAGHQPYPYSKTLAEKEAWRLAAGQDRWRLVTINPSMILGPSLGSAPTSESFTMIRMMIDGTARLGAPRVGISAVDVREVAQGHIAAAFLPEAHGRYIVSAEDTDLLALAGRLLPRFGGSFPLPRRVLPGPVLLAMAPRLGLTRAYVRRNVGYTVRSDASRSRLELGTRYRPVQASLEEMVEQMLAQQG
ncbi:NAD-dependent epimerase/dehydratase family protein [Actinomyces oris]|uniref:NAD-dependent epimerase/dehydratase family protein n=1 Tax=Actinomyces oris TaxID=544580 RepID=UPI00352D7AD9